jgi:heavy metal translocating P-type ATPase
MTHVAAPEQDPMLHVPNPSSPVPAGAAGPMSGTWRSHLRRGWLPASALATLAAGAVARIGPGWAPAAHGIWLAGLLVTGAPLVWRTLRGIARGQFASDVVATLAIVTAVVLGEPLAGLVIVLMQSGGEALEHYAAGRASDAVRELEAAAPRLAHRRDDAGTIRDVPAEQVRVDDTLIVRPGELVPCDGVVLDGASQVDVSRLTGEPMPVFATPGTALMSGSANGDSPLVVRTTAVARESQYARIVDLVRAAQESKAPLQRLADRYAVWFTPATLLACVAAYLASHDVTRVLSVLVVATPCPLLLAVPVAIIGGINQAARRRIIVRNGSALERLGAITAAVFDKTGTLTIGRPRVSAVRPAPGFDRAELLRLAAAADHGSSHLLARTLVAAAHDEGIDLPPASDVVESPGRGVRGAVDGRLVVVGARSLVAELVPDAGAALDRIDRAASGLQAYVAVDGAIAGTIEYADAPRPGLAQFFADLQTMGVVRRVLLSGDRQASVRAIGAAVGIPDARGDLLPGDKVDVVRALVAEGEAVLMVGDGTNDAPALSAATVGVALAGHGGGGGITTEAADVVVLADDVTLVADAIRISRRTLRIARQSIGAGLALSGLAMLVAALGFIPPAIGALLQEGIDVAVILNALRTSASAGGNPRR